MKRLVVTLAVAGSLVSLGPALADKGKKKPAAESADPSKPPPGQCSSLQEGLKVCSTMSGLGSFDVVTFPPALVLVTFEDKVTRVNPPPPQYFRADLRDNTVTIEPKQKGFPDPTPVVITAGSVTVTLNLRPGGSGAKAETQVIIKDPDRGVRDAEIDARVAEKLEPRLKELAGREKDLETKAGERANAILLEELVRGVDVGGPGGKGIARNDAFMVLRAQNAVRIGGRRFLVVSVENRSPTPFEIAGVRAWVSDGGAERELKPLWKFASTIISPAEEIRGAVSLPLGSKLGPKTRVRIEIEETDAKRSVQLGSIEPK